MNLKELASEVTKREGKKSQISIGDAREIVGVISDVIYEAVGKDLVKSARFFQMLVDNGARRAKRKKGKK